MNKPTPGRWLWEANGHRLYADHDTTVLEGLPRILMPNRDADGPLIAAAPALRASLMTLLSSDVRQAAGHRSIIFVSHEDLDNAWNALTQAMGEK